MKVVVIGAGYAGTLAANRLSKKCRHADITVVNPRPEFVEKVKLHQQAADTGPAVKSLTSMLRGNIELRVAAVQKIGDRDIALEDGDVIDFDHAFLAVGSTVEPIPGAVPVGSWEGANELKERLDRLEPRDTVTVIGGGPTGLETAAEIAEVRPDLHVRLVGTTVAGTFNETARRRVLASLEKLNVEVVEDSVTAVESDQAVLGSGASVGSDLTVWAIISGVPDLATRSGWHVNDESQALVDPYLRSVSNDRVFAIGDCAAVPGSHMSCQAAIPQAGHAVDNLIRLAKGREPVPFKVRFTGYCISLGRNDAVAQFTYNDNSPKRAYLSGRVATRLKRIGAGGATFGARVGFSG